MSRPIQYYCKNISELIVHIDAKDYIVQRGLFSKDPRLTGSDLVEQALEAVFKDGSKFMKLMMKIPERFEKRLHNRADVSHYAKAYPRPPVHQQSQEEHK